MNLRKITIIIISLGIGYLAHFIFYQEVLISDKARVKSFTGFVDELNCKSYVKKSNQKITLKFTGDQGDFVLYGVKFPVDCSSIDTINVNLDVEYIGATIISLQLNGDNLLDITVGLDRFNLAEKVYVFVVFSFCVFLIIVFFGWISTRWF